MFTFFKSNTCWVISRYYVSNIYWLVGHKLVSSVPNANSFALSAPMPQKMHSIIRASQGVNYRESLSIYGESIVIDLTKK